MCFRPVSTSPLRETNKTVQDPVGAAESLLISPNLLTLWQYFESPNAVEMNTIEQYRNLSVSRTKFTIDHALELCRASRLAADHLEDDLSRSSVIPPCPTPIPQVCSDANRASYLTPWVYLGNVGHLSPRFDVSP
jgi:hypothetical protein